jgi:hypothetical protein
MSNLWKEVQKFYFTNFGITAQLLDLYSSLEILSLCTQGKSVGVISTELDIEPESIRKIIRLYFHFSGFDVDLDFSPIVLYTCNGGSWEYYRSNVRTQSKNSKLDTVNLTWNICKEFLKLKERVYKNVR